MSLPARSPVSGKGHRLILSRYPTVGVFDHLTSDEEELRIAFELEAATNPRLSEAEGRLGRLPAGSLVTGEPGQGASLIMAAFIHTSPAGGRFNTPALGAWYAGLDIDTAIAETVYHNDRRLRLSENSFPSRLQLRELVTVVDMPLVDLRGCQDSHAPLYAPSDYGASQSFAERIRWPNADPGEDGLVYDSVRRAGGHNVVLFRPQAVTLPVVQGDHYQYDWDRNGNHSVYRLSRVT